MHTSVGTLFSNQTFSNRLSPNSTINLLWKYTVRVRVGQPLTSSKPDSSQWQFFGMLTHSEQVTTVVCALVRNEGGNSMSLGIPHIARGHASVEGHECFRIWELARCIPPYSPVLSNHYSSSSLHAWVFFLHAQHSSAFMECGVSKTPMNPYCASNPSIPSTLIHVGMV